MKKFSIQNTPYLCTPLVSTKKDDLLAEASRVKIKNPDIIEWRVDYFEDINNFQEVLHVTKEIKGVIGDIPLLFTIRSEEEGGNPIDLSKDKVLELLHMICMDGKIDIIDYEINNLIENIVAIKDVADDNHITLILSYHNFKFTPSSEELTSILKKAANYGADIAKIAVMPDCHSDVLRLLEVTEAAQHTLGIPVATMSMNSTGAITRVAGWIFGSSIIFTIGEKSSAPGQIPIEELRKLIYTIKQYQS